MDRSIFQIYVQKKNYNYNYPWSSTILNTIGTGFCVEIKNSLYILTNEHVISESVSVFINDVKTEVLYSDKLIDIAILNCSKKLDAIPLEIGTAKVGDTVYVHGYPIRYNIINITKGIINRFATIDYNMTKYIHMQISSIVNGGNSGGPVLYNNKVVGMCRLGNSSYQIFSCIPYFIINFHIQCFLNKTYPKTFNFNWQNINRIMYKLPQYKPFSENGSKGILVDGEYMTHIEDIEIQEKSKIKLNDLLSYLGYNKTAFNTNDNTHNFSFKYLIGLLSSKKVTFYNYYNKQKKQLALYDVNITFHKPIMHVFGGWVFVPITRAYNTYVSANYPLGKVRITQIIENELNYEFANMKKIVLNIDWNDLIALLKKHDKNKPIILPTYAGFNIYIDPAENTFTDKTYETLFQN